MPKATIRQAVLIGLHQIELHTVPRPVAGPGQVIVDVRQCGVGHDDVERWRGKEPRDNPNLIGHEVAGVVAEAGRGVTKLREGDHVAVWTPDGRGFADAMVAEARHCIKVSPSLPYPAVAEPLGRAVCTFACADHVHQWRNRGQRLDEQHVVLVGGTNFTGTLLLLFLLTQTRQPRSITVTGRSDAGLKRARTLGATHAVNTEKESAVDAVRDATGGAGADVTFEATGDEAGLLLAHEVTRQEGTVAWYGYQQGPDRALPLGKWSRKAHGIANAHFTPRDPARNEQIMDGMRAGMSLVESGALDLAPLITHRFAFPDVPMAFRAADVKPGDFMKSLVVMG